MSEDPKPLPTASFPAGKRLRPKTYSIAVIVVALFLILELVALAFIFYFRQAIVQIETSGPVLREALENPEQARHLGGANLPPIEDPSLKKLPVPAIEGRLPVPDSEANKQKRITALVEQAQTFQKQGDFSLAESSLQQALDMEAGNVKTLVGFAYLEQARGRNDKAVEWWKKIIALGPKAGPTIQLARERAALLEEKLRLEQEARARETTVLDTKTALTISQVKSEPADLAEARGEIQVDFSFTKQEAREIDPGKLRIQVYFYDRTSDNRLVPSKIEPRFLNDPPDWSRNGTEVLRVSYSKNKQEEPAARSFYGYLIRLYYNGELQAQQASPASLLTRFAQKQPS
jgi:tetratricopeptide (TPR) repeat protein